MPKLPQVKAQELIAAFHRAGFQDLRHQGTSHKHMRPSGASAGKSRAQTTLVYPSEAKTKERF